jgi:predicted RNA methylase
MNNRIHVNIKLNVKRRLHLSLKNPPSRITVVVSKSDEPVVIEDVASSKSEKKIQNHFYTFSDMARCIIRETIEFDENDYDLVIEPSAGTGSFSNLFKEFFSCDTVAMDTDPQGDHINHTNFYDYYPDNKYKIILVIGNPPFGCQGSEAVKFFNHAAEWADTIAFIVPKSFRRPKILNRLHKSFHLELDIELEADYKQVEFTRPDGTVGKATCCFQIWKRHYVERTPIILPASHKDWTFISANHNYVPPPEDAEIAIRAHGSNVGESTRVFDGLSPKSWYFIKTNKDGLSIDELELRFSTLSYYPEAYNTGGGQHSIGRGIFISLYMDKYG